MADRHALTVERPTQPRDVDPKRSRYPFSVVWGPLCPLTCCCPCVGHMGVGDSEGKIHDFAGSEYVSIDRFMVGCVWRYSVVDGAAAEPERWNAAIRAADTEYRKHAHNICCDNCHHHSALALTEFGQPSTLLSAWIHCCCRGSCTWCM